jgi:hypothetical protein
MPAAQQQQHEPPHHHHHQLEHGTPSTLGKRGSEALALARAARPRPCFFQHEFSRLEQHGQRRRLAENSVLDSAKPRQEFPSTVSPLPSLSMCQQQAAQPRRKCFSWGGFFCFSRTDRNCRWPCRDLQQSLQLDLVYFIQQLCPDRWYLI